MTTVTFQGVRTRELLNNKGEEVGADMTPSELRVVYSGNAGTLRYTNTPDPEDDLPFSDIKENDAIVGLVDGTIVWDGLIEREQEAGFVGRNQTEDDFYTRFGEITWNVNGKEGTTQILAIDWERPVSIDAVDYYYFIGGDAMPDSVFASNKSWFNFIDSDDTITGAGPITGAFGPKRNIDWADWSLATVEKGQKFVGSNKHDWMQGTAGADNMRGLGGDDYFESSKGKDIYNGGKGLYDQVTYRYDPGGVRVDLTKKSNNATDGWGNKDTLIGIEMLRGSGFNDVLKGKFGKQIFRGLDGKDTINGGAGVDEVRYDRDNRDGGNAGVNVDLGQGFAIDGFGKRDKLMSIENARGSDAGDILKGSKAANQLRGENGNDSLAGRIGKDNLQGGGGKDTLDGGAGNDILSGGGGGDLFVFGGKFGRDKITDFSLNPAEKINLKAVKTINNFNDLKTNHISEKNGNVLIDAKGGNTIELVGIDNVSQLQANDFLF